MLRHPRVATRLSAQDLNEAQDIEAAVAKLARRGVVFG